MKPFLKWAGSKYRIIDRIKNVLPPGKRLIEPFAGSGAVFLNTNYSLNLIADSNPDLINLFRTVQTEAEDFVFYCKQLFTPDNNQQDVYYELRQEFNTTNDQRRKSALFVYLNRHCFNGLCRYNAKGGFNVPFGRYAKPPFPEKEMINFSRKSESAEFIISDFTTTMKGAQSGDVVYCDPPYVPLSATSNFTDYTLGGFSLVHQQKLADMANILMSKGVPVVISNHDTDFTRNAYSSAKINAFDVQRFISSNGTNRGKAGELLALFGGAA